MKMKKPETLYSMIASDEDEVKSLSDKELEKLTKLSRKSWRIRVLRYSKIVPAGFFHEDPFSLSFKFSLKSWVKSNIPFDGGTIFKGKFNTETDDWLAKEVVEWRMRIKQEEASVE